MRVFRYQPIVGVDPSLMTLTFKDGETLYVQSSQCQREIVDGVEWLVCEIPEKDQP